MMILQVIFLFLCAKVTESAYEGDPCTLPNRIPGVCALLNNCESVYQQLLAGNSPDTLCGYSGFEPVVCCPTSAPTTSTTPEPVIAENRAGDDRGSIARQKCAEYKEFVYSLRYPISAAGNRTPIKFSECAIVSQKLIVGGTLAERKEFPHMAAVGYNVTNSRIGWYCGGTLISETFVLTAAHCTFSTNWGTATWVRVGDLNLMRPDDGATPEDRRITERIRHPQYKLPSRYHDIALLRLESRVPFNGWIRPACLHTAPTTGTEKAIATGWGQVGWDAEGSNNLLKVTLPIVGQASCNASYSTGIIDDRLRNGIVGEWTLCAGVNGQDTCQGDSGGPLVIFSKPEYYCMYDVVGVTSFGSLCGSTVPGVYTRVYHYVPWIESVVWP